MPMSILYRSLAVLLLSFFVTGTAPLSADSGTVKTPAKKPLWEVGIAGNMASIPLYRGSADEKFYALPLPYFIYRGRFFQSDRDGFRGIFYSSDQIETSLSGGGNPPVDDDGTAREGMGDLDALLELGPALKWHPFKRQPNQRFYFQTAARAIFSIGIPDDLRTHHRGYRVTSSLHYRKGTIGGNPAWRWGASLGFDFTDSEYNNYVYGVSDQYANELRPTYTAKGGYAGAMASTYLVRRLTDTLSLAVYTRIDNLSGAVYESSPLVETSNNFTVAASFIWKLRESLESAPTLK